jgi:predicted CXXCH cytochrome family protein
MSVTFQASTASVPPSNRQYLLELLRVPAGVTGVPAVGTVWVLPLVGQLTLYLPTYRATDGLTGYQFAFTVTEAAPSPGDIDNDGDADETDYASLQRCLTGPTGEPGPSCEPVEFNRSDLNDDGYVDLADFSIFATHFTGMLVSPATFVGATQCIDCHEADCIDWMGTMHATAFSTLQNEGEERNPACLPCHTVGYGQRSGFVDLQTTPDLANVQCENCHGPGSQHVEDFASALLEVELDAALCGQCHRSCHGQCGDYYHPNYEQWSVSKHAAALGDIRWLPEYEESCLQCHSADYRLAPEGEKPAPWRVLYSLECVACHRARGSGNVSQLRLPPPALCADCHTMGSVTPGRVPERTQCEMLHGVGGFVLDQTPLAGPHTAHYSTVPDECAACHVYREAYGGPEQPSNSGHTFEPNMRACDPCHSELDAAALVAGARQEIESRLAAISHYLDPRDPLYVNPFQLTPEELDRYLVAKFDYEFVAADRSYGSHNINYARALLLEAESFFGIGH